MVEQVAFTGVLLEQVKLASTCQKTKISTTRKTSTTSVELKRVGLIWESTYLKHIMHTKLYYFFSYTGFYKVVLVY